MIDYHANLVASLEKVLPTYYELVLTPGIDVPCISYQETNNYATDVGDTLGYSRLQYRIKVWGHDISELQKYALQIDLVLRPLGFKRTASNELHDPNSTMIQKIMSYEALALENY